MGEKGLIEILEDRENYTRTIDSEKQNEWQKQVLQVLRDIKWELQQMNKVLLGGQIEDGRR